MITDRKAGLTDLFPFTSQHGRVPESRVVMNDTRVITLASLSNLMGIHESALRTFRGLSSNRKSLPKVTCRIEDRNRAALRLADVRTWLEQHWINYDPFITPGALADHAVSGGSVQ